MKACRFGPFRLDTAKRRLWRGDELVPLTPKAFDTLAALVAAAGRVVDKDDLLKAVWPDTFVEEVTLAQNISTLRRALGDTADTPEFIATIPRRGYQFVAHVTDVLDARAGAAVEPSIAPAGAPQATAGRGRERVWMAVSAALALGLLAIGVRALRPTPPSGPSDSPVVFAITPPEGTIFSPSGGFMALSPDGGSVAFVASSHDGTDRLWLRSLDSLAARALPGTEGASQPFWAPDSRFVAFFADGKLKKIAVAAGPAQTICAIASGWIPLAGTWNRRDDILFSSVGTGIVRVPATGGTAAPLVAKEAADDYVAWPEFLPDDRQFLYVLGSTRSDRTGIYVGALDSTERVRLVATRSYAQYAPSGHLLFVQDGTLVAQPFDGTTRTLRGAPLPVAERVAFNAGTARGTFAISRNGVLVYRAVPDSQLVWFDRAGQRLGPVGPVGAYFQFSIAPDGARVAAARLDPQTATSDIWIIDAVSASERRLTFDPSWDNFPLWSRDGSRIVFSSNRRGRWEIYEKAASGDTPDRQLVASEISVNPTDVSTDGRLLFQRSNENMKGRFFTIGPGDEKPSPLPELDSNENDGRISPDGRWLAYTGYQAGMSVYVRPVQSVETRWQVSSAGGNKPVWRADGKELFYFSPDLSVMALDVEPRPKFRAGPARRLFRTQALAPSGVNGNQAYDVSPDGRRFLIKTPASPSSITVVVNWTARFANGR